MRMVKKLAYLAWLLLVGAMCGMFMVGCQNNDSGSEDSEIETDDEFFGEYVDDELGIVYVLNENGLNPEEDVNMVTNIDFTATSGAFKSGTAEYVALFEPTASMLEKDGSGYIVSSIGESAGNIAYTCFYSTKSYMEKNPEIIQSFTNAIYKGQIWIKEHTSEEIADSIISFFPGTDKEIIISVLDNYKEIDAYCDTPMVKEEELNKLMDIIEGYDESLIKERPPFEVIVDNTFAEKASK